MEAYPNAKVLLSVRDPQKWYTSVKNTIYQFYLMGNVFPYNIFFRLMDGKLSNMVANVCCLPTNGLPGKEVKNSRSRIPESYQNKRIPKIIDFYFSGMYNSISKGEEASINHFNQWVQEVKKTVPSDKLLVFEVKEGWGPLCKFLEVPVPNIPFPNTNDTAQMKKRLRGVQIAAYSLILGVPTVLAAILYFTKQYWSKYVPFL